MRRHKKKSSSDTVRSHVILLASVTLLTGLVVMLGRQPVSDVAHRRAPARTPLELRRPVALSISDPIHSVSGLTTTITPIPLPGQARSQTTTEADFVPLTRPVVERSVEPPVATRAPENVPLPIDVPSAELRWHRVVEGESLETIAQRYFGSTDRAGDIFALNRDLLTQPDVLPLGVHLRLPPTL